MPTPRHTPTVMMMIMPSLHVSGCGGTAEVVVGGLAEDVVLLLAVVVVTLEMAVVVEMVVDEKGIVQMKRSHATGYRHHEKNE